MYDGTATGAPKTGHSSTISRTAKLFAIVCVPAIVVLVYYAPSLTAFGWHLLHVGAVRYHGLHVEVPWGWTTDLTALNDDIPGNPQGITLQKTPRTLKFEARGPELIYINVLQPDERSTPQQQTAEWQDLFRGSHPATEFDVKLRDEKPGGAECIEATPRSNPRGAALACISSTEGWLANFAGSQTDVPVFLRVLAGLRRER